MCPPSGAYVQKEEKMKPVKYGVILLALLLAAMAMVPMVSANENPANENVVGKTVPAPTPLPLNPNSPPAQEGNDGVLIENTTAYLTYWNEKMKWGLSDEQISTDVKKLESDVLPKYRDPSNSRQFNIDNLSDFSKELANTLGLTNNQASEYVTAHKLQLVSDHQNYHKSGNSLKSTETAVKATTTISPSTQSAPYAYGKTYYLYIFTNFQIPGSDGTWTTTHINDALNDASTGTNAIRTQAPSNAAMVNSGGYYTVTVSGQDTGDTSQAWGTGGWMERAATAIGYSDSNGDGRITDDMARSIKSANSANAVAILYLTHDDKGGYAVGPDQGYADKLALSYWGNGSSGRFDSVPGSYEHEVLHLFGALDEYSGASYCGQTSSLAVDPMHQLYTNTNHIGCSGSTNSVMRDPYSTSTISLSSKRFIGWGDHDSDGILDPADSTP